MSVKHLLIHVESTPRSMERLDLAVALARKFSARLTGLFAEVDQLGPSIVARRAPDAVREARARTQKAFAAKATAAGVETDWWPVEATAYGEILDLTATCCRYVDLAVLGQHDRANERAPKDLVEQVMLNSGRPVLVVPSVGHYTDVGRRVVIAWNSSPESARAVNDAIPLIQGADTVRIVTFQRHAEGEDRLPMPRVDIVAHLAAHGIAARDDLVVRDDERASIAETVLNHAFDMKADLTVVGGFGERFPFPHAVGSTRDILRSMPSPVLFSH